MQSLSPHHQDDFISEEEARRRQLLALARRPSYRKILSDLEGLGRSFQPKLEVSDENTAGEEANSSGSSVASTSAVPPLTANSDKDSTASVSPSSQNENLTFTSLPPALTIRLENGGNDLKLTDLSRTALLQYAQQQSQQIATNQTLLLPLSNDVMNIKALTEGQVLLNTRTAGNGGSSGDVFVDSNSVVVGSGSNDSTFLLQPSAAAAAVAAAAVLTQAAAATSAAVGNISPGSAASTAAAATLTLPTTAALLGAQMMNGQQQQQVHRPQSGGRSTDDPQKKREVRLLKNREAAKECRRKKKEYIKCLENRVNTLEHQNTQLIEELKNLKALYCRKVD